MKGRKVWYLLLIVAIAVLPFIGCSGGGGNTASVASGEKGVSLTVGGTVDAGKSLGKTVGADTDPLSGTVKVLNAADASVLASANIGADGSFSGLAFTLPATKSIIVFRADTNKSPTPFYNIVPIDLSNPPAPGIGASNAITILISQVSTSTASVVSSVLGLSGVLPSTTPAVTSGMLGDNALPTGQTYATAAQMVSQYGGQILAYNTSGLSLTGSLKEALLPAQDANTLTGDQINSLTLDGKVTGVSIPGKNPIISFQVTNKASGKGIRGLKTFAFAFVQLVPAATGGPDEWMSYMVASATLRPSTESSVSTTSPVGTLIDNGDGSYVYKMYKDVKTAGTNFGAVYDANRTHRVAIQVRTPPVAGTTSTGAAITYFTNPINILYDFVPASGAPTTGMLKRDIATTAACNECHTKIGTSTPHPGRVEVGYCAVCHTKQRANGQTASTEAAGAFTGPVAASGSQAGKVVTYVVDGRAVGNLVNMVHKIHMGNGLTKQGYNYAGVLFNDITYPQDVTNCRKCHKGDTTTQLAAAPQGNNWQTKPSRLACGACHDNIDFATGANLKKGVVTGAVDHLAQADDSACNSCHGPTSPYAPGKVHMTVNATPNNPNVAVGLTNFTYDINSVTVDGTNQTVIKFRILASTDGSTPTAITFGGTGATNANPLPGFTGGPSFLLAYSLSATNQPFTTTPDYNNVGVKAAQPISVSIANLYDGAKGTLVAGTGADAGYYIATIKGDKAPPTSGYYSFPVGAKMRAVALQGYFTQAAGTNGIAAATARHAVSVQKPVKDDAVRRQVIDSAKCASCHEWFEGHGGNRVYEVQVCVLCHVPNLSSSGKGANAANVSTAMSATDQAKLVADGYTLADPTTYPEETNNFKDMIHGIHAGSSRANPLKFVRDRTTVLMYFTAAEFVFPGILKECTMCHVPVTSSNPSYAGIPAGAQVTTDLTSNGTALTLTNNVATVSAARTSLPNATDLVTTPFTAACVSCHDSVAAKAHMKLNGGQIRVQRSTADPALETCVVCHGTTGTANIVNAHK